MSLDIATIMLMGSFLLLFSTVSLVASIYVIHVVRKYKDQQDRVMEAVQEVGQQVRILIDKQKK